MIYLLAFDSDAVPKHMRWTPEEFDTLAHKLRDDPVEYYKEAAEIIASIKLVVIAPDNWLAAIGEAGTDAD